LPLSRKSRALRAAVIVALGVLAWCWLRSSGAGAAGGTAASANRPAASAGTTAADRARRAAAMALAQRPDDPWLRARSAHAASAANAASATLARCGGDEVAQYGEQPEPTERDGMMVSGPPPLIKPAGPGYVAATQRIDASLRGSGDPYARAVADWLNVGDAKSPDDRIAALVNDAASTRDPRVYSIAYHACRPFGVGATPAPACALLSARRWVALDPGNGVPWLAAFSDAHAQGDAEGQREALFHMASSTRWHEGYADAPAVVGAQLQDDDASAAANFDLAVKAMTASLTLWPSSLAATCKDKAGGDADRAQQCVAIAHLMYDQADTIMDHMLGGAVYLQATGDPSLREAAHADYRRISAAVASAASAADTAASGVSGCADYRTLGKLFKRGSEIGELAALRERTHVPPPP
jgi:hypothetical protein